MDASVLDFRPDGQVQYEVDGWARPTLQETRAIIHAAQQEIEALEELIATLEAGRPAGQDRAGHD
jgi:hypothetical protein